MMMQRLRSATWNLEHPKPKSPKKTPAVLDQIQTINADVWILTETNNLAVDLSKKGYFKFSSIEYQDKRLDQNAYTTIWSRIQAPTEMLKTFDPILAVCIKVNLQGYNLLIYGTIITWHGDRGIDGKSKSWEEHYQSIEQHGNDWEHLAKTNPDCKLITAGDFNQARDGSRWYGTQKGIALLTHELKRNNLVCLTDEVKPKERHNIDHICVSYELQPYCRVGFWENISDSNVTMSDHNGVFVDVELQA